MNEDEEEEKEKKEEGKERKKKQDGKLSPSSTWILDLPLLVKASFFYSRGRG